MNKIFLMLTLLCMSNSSIDAAALKKLPKNPFSYDLGVRVVPSKKVHDIVTICCHGYGHNNHIVDFVSSSGLPLGALVGFNFPDHDINAQDDHKNIAYGTPQEILPLLYLLNYYACDVKIPVINLYGFSAGGSAIINALSFLVHHIHDAELAKLGITQEHKKKILHAVQKGLVILDCPLKSVEEIIASRGKSPELEIMQRNFVANKQDPITVLPTLHNLNFTIILYFEKPDNVIGNRDDDLFVARLRQANKGKTIYLNGSYGGHATYHKKLWDYIKSLDI